MQNKWLPNDDFFFEADEPRVWSEEDWEQYLQDQEKRATLTTRKTRDIKQSYQEHFNGDFPSIQCEHHSLNTNVQSNWLNQSQTSDYPTISLESMEHFLEQGGPSIDDVPIYRLVLMMNHDFSKFILSHLQSGETSPEVHQINTHFFQIQSHIVAGHTLGYEGEGLSGNIVRLKRALKCAQTCMDSLLSLKRKRVVHDDIIESLICYLNNIRDQLIRYILDLRSQQYLA